MKMTRRTIAKPDAPAATEPVEEELTVIKDEDLEGSNKPYVKQAMPKDRFEMHCGECKTLCYVHVEDKERYSPEMVAQLFVDRGGSYNPPLCGYCKRREDRAKSNGKALIPHPFEKLERHEEAA